MRPLRPPILLIISKPNPIIISLIIQNLFLVEKQAKTWLPQSMLIFLSSIACFLVSSGD